MQSLEEVTVTADQIQALKPQMSTVQLSTRDIKNIPAFLGEVDVIRAIQLLPGVQSGSEGTTGFYVRGGSPDQNLILLDGVPVYNASHLFGFFSVFNADAIKNVQLTKGGFPARFGGRLSSVLEIDMKEGNLREFHGAGSVGLISSKLTLEGPLVKDRTSFIISGRRTYYDLLIQPFLPDYLDAGYYFGDLNLKVNHIFSRKDRLYLSYYGGLDKFYQRETYDDFGYEERFESSLKWGNHTGSLRWNHLFSEKLFSNLTATYTQYKFNVGFSEEYNGQTDGFEYFSRIRDYGLRYDMEYRPNSDHSLRFGGNYTYHTFNPGVAQFKGGFTDEGVDSVLNLSKPIYSHDAYAYVEDDWLINSRWRANFGLHYSAYLVNTTFYNSLQPRASLR
ncbi:MAG: TonB-dependent receptor plug domain-containing protein, partial [Owenweeksia sp.]